MTQHNQHTASGVTLRGLASLDALTIERLSAIYHEAFPPEERRPWQQIIHPAAPGAPTLLAIYLDGTPVGLLSYWLFNQFYYIEHLAISQDVRSAGVGSRALATFINDIAKPLPVVVEVEKPESAPIAARRVAFYQRHGFSTISTDYIQPPYADDLEAVPLDLMATDAQLNAGLVTTTLHKRVYQRFNVS
jgi:ribosomal protein S18 acetylase RimI-like enzyme